MDEAPLSSEEERALFQALRGGDPAAAQRLFTANRRLAQTIARSYHRRSFERHSFESLVRTGEKGLLLAIGRFTPGKGYRFATYATHWVRQSIGRAIDAAV